MRRRRFFAHALFVLLVAQTTGAQDAVTLSIETPRRAFYRGEEILLNVRCVNGSGAPIAGTLSADLGGCLGISRDIAALPAGGETAASFRFATQTL